MLTHADVCWDEGVQLVAHNMELLANADVCGRMLTYADEC
jgi:hypothetical protein